MKKRSILFTVVMLIISICLTSCAAGVGKNNAPLGGADFAPEADGGFSGAPDADYGGGYGDAEEAYPPTEPGDVADEGDTADKTDDKPVQSTAGLITASAWDDNFYYSEWLALFAQSDDGSAGRLSDFMHSDRSWGMNTHTRVKLTVKNGDKPVAGARVTVDGKDGQLGHSAITDAGGVAYLFPGESGSVTVTLADSSATAKASFDSESRDLTVELAAESGKRDVIELMFVIDATGSMGDEISYLKNEIADVIGRISDGNDTTVYLSFLFYRDHCDSVVFDYVDFVNVSTPSGLEAQRLSLSERYATGGGDYAEAADEALLLAAGKQWSAEATTKIIFQLLDAPPHSTDENKATMRSAVASLASQGIRFCPVLCSGADTLTEYVMREAAVYTGGRFVFVTDHSGIGGSHHDPDIPNATVEALNSLMVRLVRGYHSGVFDDPVDWRADQNK